MTSPAPRPPRTAGGIPVGRLGGIKIVLSWSWLLSVAIIVVLATPVVRNAVPGTSTATAAWVAALLGVLLGASVLVHELGHCLAARSLGVPVTEVRLYLLGGVSELGRAPATAREEAVIAAAGPGLSVVLTVIFALLVGSTDQHTIPWLLLLELAFINGIVAVFNLLPALPLDGGRVLRAGVWGWFGRRRLGTLVAAGGGYLVAAGLIVWGIVQFGGSRGGILQGGISVAMALFVAMGALSEQRADRAVDWPADATLAALARPVVQLPVEVPVDMALRAAAGRAVILTGPDGLATGLLDETAAIALARQNPRTPALHAVRPIPPQALVLDGDDPAEVALRAESSTVADFLLIGPDGQPVGVLPAAVLTRILAQARRAD